MYMLNRAAVTIIAKQPFVDWINSTKVSEEDLTFSVGMVNEEPQVFLVRSYEDVPQQQKYVNKLKPMLFEVMLDGYYNDETAWPTDRSAKAFDKWFELTIHSMVLDVEDSTINRDEH